MIRIDLDEPFPRLKFVRAHRPKEGKGAGRSRSHPARTLAGSNTAMSAFIPGRSIPRSSKPRRCAGNPDILRTASSSVIVFFSRT